MHVSGDIILYISVDVAALLCPGATDPKNKKKEPERQFS